MFRNLYEIFVVDTEYLVFNPQKFLPKHKSKGLNTKIKCFLNQNPWFYLTQWY